MNRSDGENVAAVAALREVEHMLREAAAIATAGWRASYSPAGLQSGDVLQVHRRQSPALGTAAPSQFPAALVNFGAQALRCAESLKTPLTMYGGRSTDEGELTLCFRDPGATIGAAPVYHGTSEGSFRAIREAGLEPSREGYVHLSTDERYARSYASRKNGRLLRVPRLAGMRPDMKTSRAPDRDQDVLYPDWIPPEQIEIFDSGRWVPIREYEHLDTNIRRLPPNPLWAAREAEASINGPDFAVIHSLPGERYAFTAYREGVPLDAPIIARAGSLLSLIHYRLSNREPAGAAPKRPRPMRPR